MMSLLKKQGSILTTLLNKALLKKKKKKRKWGVENLSEVFVSSFRVLGMLKGLVVPC